MAVGPRLAGGNKITADTAGKTVGTSRPVTTVAPTGVQNLSHDLGFLSGGPHPEKTLSNAVTALTRATDSIRGPHGGTVANQQGTQAPGPAGSVASAEKIATDGKDAVARATNAGKSIVHRIREAF